MTRTDPFSDRLDRMKAETDPQHTTNGIATGLAHPKDDGFGLRQMAVPVLSLSLLALGAFAFANVLASDTNGPFDLEAAIIMNNE